MAQHAAGRRRLWPWAIAVLGLGLVAFVGAFAWDAAQALRSKDALTVHAAAAQAALQDGDPSALTEEVRALESAAQEFAAATSGPHWWIASQTPWLTHQVTPLMVAGAAIESLAADALAPIADMGNLEALSVPEFSDGRIDPWVLEPYRATLATAAEAVAEQTSALEAVPLSRTVALIEEPFLELEQQLREVGALLQSGHVAAELLPAMLGGEGERHYLVMVQNNAEPRATGGIPGAVISVTVDDGRMTMGRYASATEMVQAEGVGGLTDDEERIFTRRMEVYPHDVNFTPEFPRSAELMTRFWDASYGEAVDGVLSLDPVALGWILEGAPATEIGGFTIDDANLAQVMLNESYLAFEDPSEQDAFFARASAELFQRIVSGEASALQGVEQAIDSNRFLLWSAEPDEQALLASTPVAGAFLESADALGVFINDGSGSKIGWYIDNSTTVTDKFCTDGSFAGQNVSITLTHTFDGDVASLPAYISGDGVYVPPAEFQANVLLYPAEGTAVTGFLLDGESASLNPELHEGRSVTSARVTLLPGEAVTLTYEIQAFTRDALPPRVVETPGPQPRIYIRDRFAGDVEC